MGSWHYALACLCVGLVLASAARCDADSRIYTTETQVDGEIRWLEWLPPDYETVLVRTSANTIYLSNSGGADWVDQSTKLASFVDSGPYTAASGIRGLYVTANETKFLFLGFDGRIWKTTDKGATYTYEQFLQTPFNTLLPHPSNADWILGASWSLTCYNTSYPGYCHRDIFVSQDFGTTWTVVDSYVSQFSWGAGQPNPSTIWYSTWLEKTGNQREKTSLDLQFGYSDDFGNSQFNSLVPNCAGFLHTGDVIFVATIDQTHADLTLVVSVDDGAHFKEAVFPAGENVQENRYTILDTSEGNAFINVDHSSDNSWGYVYSSDAFDSDFELSLKYNKRGGGGCDFERVSGLDGIYIANVVDVISADKQVSTLITYDQGGEWSLLQEPEGSICLSGKCELNLNGPSTSWYGQAYTKDSALGLVLATGNVGPYLYSQQDEINTFFSRDAGFTWQKVYQGSHTYEFGDHGSLVLLVNDETATDSISYSWTQGLNFTECVAADNGAFEIENVIVEPSSRASKFNVYGTRSDEGKIQGVLVHVDFSSFHQRKCVSPESPYPENPDSDFEVFIPHGTTDCLLGQKMSITRRRQTAACFVGLDHEPVTVLGRCPCSREDYECDDCYLEQTDGTCTKVNNCKPTDQGQCQNGVLLQSQGYKLITGDQCTSWEGDPYAPVAAPCSSGTTTSSATSSTGHNSHASRSSSEEKKGHGTAILVAVVLVVAVIVLVVVGLWYGSKKNENLRRSLGKCFPCCRDETEKAFYGKLTADDHFDLDDEALHSADVLDDAAIDSVKGQPAPST